MDLWPFHYFWALLWLRWSLFLVYQNYNLNLSHKDIIKRAVSPVKLIQNLEWSAKFPKILDRLWCIFFGKYFLKLFQLSWFLCCFILFSHFWVIWHDYWVILLGNFSGLFCFLFHYVIVFLKSFVIKGWWFPRITLSFERNVSF